MNAPHRGRLIVVEGIDGAGKSTQVVRLAEALRGRGLTVTTSREPTDGPWGRKIRASAVSGRMTLEDELAAFLADRKEHVAGVIQPALDRGERVILDRYYYSTIAYQGARGGDVGAIRAANEAIAPKPDLVLLIDFDPELALRRIRESRGGAPDEFEKLDELRAIRGIFLQEAAADPERFRILDGSRPPDEVFADLLAATTGASGAAAPPTAGSGNRSTSADRLTVDFSNVSGEIQSITARRRELLVFLGSMFAAMSLFLQKVLDGELPEALKSIEHGAFFAHSLLVLVPTIITALRVAKLHGGLVINGVFYARAVNEVLAEGGTRKSLRDAARLNYFGMSAMLFWLTGLLAGGESCLLALSCHAPIERAAALGVAAVVVLAIVFLVLHRQAARFALRAADSCRVEPFSEEEHERHLLDGRNEANRDMIAVTSFAGLMMFSSLECITGLANIGAANFDLAPQDVLRFGPVAYLTVWLVSCCFCGAIYLRLAVAIGNFSLQLDPTDRPFRALKFTDTLLGYLLLVFFLIVGAHLAAYSRCGADDPTVFAVDAIVGVAAAAAYPLTMFGAARRRLARVAAK